jgi:L-ascorbate metabolism protein UlaG (beta-lactamase superfamily)
MRWLGAAGIEIACGGRRLLIDPYLTRVPFRSLFSSRPRPNGELIRRHLHPADAVLVTHPHFDHLLDVPVVCRSLGAKAYGSANACALLAAAGVPAALREEIRPGARFESGPFAVETHPGEHGRILGFLPHAGRLRRRLRYPFRLDDYRMDGMLSFRVTAAGFSILVWNNPSEAGAPAADLLLYSPLWGSDACVGILRACGARRVAPIHWDDFFSPLDKPLTPIVGPPGWGRRGFRRMVPERFLRSVADRLPGIQPVLPQIFVPFPLE